MLPENVDWAHDMRMPLQLICSGAQMIKQSLADPSLDAAAYADMLVASAEQLKRLMERALESGEAAPMPLMPRPVDLVACARALCHSCRAYAEQRGVALRFASNVAALTLPTDEDALSRIILNLISNALRFTPSGGRIRVTLTALGDAVELTVADTGAGIPPERQPFVFLRGETDGGHGHGLPIARRLARSMGGELTLESTPGRGSAFTLRLPARASRAG